MAPTICPSFDIREVVEFNRIGLAAFLNIRLYIYIATNYLSHGKQTIYLL